MHYDPDRLNLSTILVAVTRNCPLGCAHCFESEALDCEETLSLNELQNIIKIFQDNCIVSGYRIIDYSIHYIRVLIIFAILEFDLLTRIYSLIMGVAAHKGSVLGIDIGSVAISVVQMDIDRKILKYTYQFHKGRIRDYLRSLRDDFDLKEVHSIACTTISGVKPEHVKVYNPQVAVIKASRVFCPGARSILWVGAEKFMVIRLDENGNYDFTATNSSCAAGTGSFLDQQAFRLNLSGIEELSHTALRNRGDIPEIASRCAVFAKTDLIHAQQRGYSIEAICDSLCRGLAKNITDTLFSKETPALPVLFIGGVSMNGAVAKHLENLLDTALLKHQFGHLFGAAGTCLMLLDDLARHATLKIDSLEEIIDQDQGNREYFYEPLTLKLSDYPDFSAESSSKFKPQLSDHTVEVEVDIYHDMNNSMRYNAYLGIDIGSTSTKAILTDEFSRPLAGLYTYTAGKPLAAVKSLLEALSCFISDKRLDINILGVGTTGSGRKFIGKIIGADMIIDEITTHARAAYQLNPDTDTIIEIGGQDAKFTMMHEGRVTFSQMNTVCAAGTGSFIEEQATKLDCQLTEYSKKVENVRAPLASDRCTVFMERDINQLLNNGFSVDEILATTLHSVTENYLKKVATGGSIGRYICFQGATARNRSLVAAFEQRLKTRIFVSRYCHLTGALGTAILLREEMKSPSTFPGLDLYREEIPIDSETCILCTNNCHISIANVKGEKVAYGFMCGRDYDTRKFVNKNTSGFDMLLERKKILDVRQDKLKDGDLTIGLPASLHVFEDLNPWKNFFKNLSIKTISSENFHDPVKTGKRIAGAEFCAPIDSIYGHVAYLAEKADFIFLPVSIESRTKPDKKTHRNFCYYTQFSPSLVYMLKDKGIEEKILSPYIDFFKGNRHIARNLLNILKPIAGDGISYSKVKSSWEKAQDDYLYARKQLDRLYKQEFGPEKDISCMLMGRPYVVLSGTLNKGIPDILAGMGIKTFFQDMMPADMQTPEDIEFLVKKLPWHFAVNIMETAKRVALTENLYPVLITAFKCAPDSLIIDYFKKVFHNHKKPYLILQIDEHDSNVGYETRIESALRSFRNHAALKKPREIIKSFSILPQVETRLNGRTLLFPDWDPLVSRLIVANLKRSGIDARRMESNDLIIKKSMAHNTGQCLPMNIITQECIEYVEKHDLKAENTVIWMLESFLTCNLRMYPFNMKTLLENYGKGFEKISVYSGELSHFEISYRTGFYAYFAYLLGGLIRKLGCKIRPYEKNKGKTDSTIQHSIAILEEAFLGNRSMDKAVAEAIGLFDDIEKEEVRKPKVAIFGDFYVRDNDVMNQGLLHVIEGAGGEVLTTPYNDYLKITFENTMRPVSRGEYLEVSVARLMLSALKLVEKKYYKYFEKHLGKAPVTDPIKLEQKLKKFNIDRYHSGESYDNILKIFYIIENYPDVSLFVQTNPAFCCPSLVTEAMTREIRRITGVPVVTITYDGTSELKNDIVIPYLQELR